MLRRPPISLLFPYTTLFRSFGVVLCIYCQVTFVSEVYQRFIGIHRHQLVGRIQQALDGIVFVQFYQLDRSEEHMSELSHVEISYAVFWLKKKKKKNKNNCHN